MQFPCDFLLLLFFGRLLVQRERKEATQIFGLRGSWFYKSCFLHIRYYVYSSVRVFVESPIYLIIG